MVAYKKKIAKPQPHITPQEYLERERKAETRSEYYGGVIVAMTGASWEHNLITGNIARRLGNQLEGKPCVVVTNDLRVRALKRRSYYYPDVVVVCGEPLFEDVEFDTLINPTLVIEVLSDSTEATDRGEKLRSYQALSSLNTYVLVSQGQPLVEIYRRQERGWLHSVVSGLESVLSLDAIGCELRLADIYDRIALDETQTEPDAGEAT